MSKPRKPRKPTKRQQEEIDNQRVRRSYHRVAANVEVPITALTRIKNAGLSAIAAGADDTTLDAWVKAVVDEVRTPA
jgi:hypothetical protein